MQRTECSLTLISALTVIISKKSLDILSLMIRKMTVLSGNPPKKRRNLILINNWKANTAITAWLNMVRLGTGKLKRQLTTTRRISIVFTNWRAMKNIMEYGLRTERRFRNQVFSLELMIITLFMRVILMMSKEIHLTINWILCMTVSISNSRRILRADRFQ